ncbi:MAG: LacI family transcriptional regulator [Chloroflexi bacterium]|nr:LacI family transcriptional regulator [Chloroflexota bacterium]
MVVSIRDVARLAGVSSATVSRVLTHKPHVREEVRQRVLQAVAELGYRPSRVARSLRVRSSQIIGLIISDIQNPFFTALVRAVEDRAYENGYAVFLCNSDENAAKEALYIDLMLSEQVAGVILTPTRETESPCRKLLEANIPVVAVDRRITDLSLDTVVIDNVQAAYELTRHLLEAGHRRIGAILGAPQITTGRERLAGYERALQEWELALDERLVITGSPKEALGYEAANRLLDLPDPPTAIFAGNNLLTMGALRAIDERGLQILQDLSLVGFDDMEWTSMIRPRLTVIAQPTYEIGRMAADLILDRIANPTRSERVIVMKPELRRRESVLDLQITERR